MTTPPPPSVPPHDTADPARGPAPSDRATVSRRRLLGAAAVGGAAVVGGVAYGLSDGGSPPRPPARPKAVRPVRTPAMVMGRTPDGVLVPQSPAIIAENARPGDAWWVTQLQPLRSLEGFASTTSAVAGQEVALYVHTVAPHFHVEAYRMGYYGGVGGRLVWRSDDVAGSQQPDPVLLSPTNTVECNWEASLTVTPDATWVPGAYLLKLVGAGGEQQYVPLCIRDDASQAAFVIQHSVTTWQAYNLWGGYSLYYGRTGAGFTFTQYPGGGAFADRARVVSFDRPYPATWASGAADFIGDELPLIYDAERLGLDVTYWTDVDLHAAPTRLLNHRCLFSLGHDEYWSTPMRDGATTALQNGVNLAFLGANACYRQIRLQPSPVGMNRRQVCYKDAAEDPLTGRDDALVTVNWPQAPVNRPESELIGLTYQDVGAQADLVVADASHWLLDGTGLRNGQRLPGVVRGEFDRYSPGELSPPDLDVVAHSVVANRGGNYSDLSWSTTPGGGGVFASGNATFVGFLADNNGFPTNIVPVAVPGVTAPLLRLMQNVYAVLGTGPGASHPSQGTWRAVYGGAGSTPTASAATVNTA
jgi:hypothetical protein